MLTQKTLILLSWNNFWTILAICVGSMSCWNVHFLPSWSFYADCLTFSCRILIYCYFFLMPSTFDNTTTACGCTKFPQHYIPQAPREWGAAGSLHWGPWGSSSTEGEIVNYNLSITFLWLLWRRKGLSWIQIAEAKARRSPTVSCGARESWILSSLNSYSNILLNNMHTNLVVL